MNILIVGGGIAGLSACYHLLEHGHKPLLIEQSQLGHGTTWAAAGMLAPVHELEFTELPLLAAGRASLKLYDQWEKVLGNAIGLNRSGTLEVAPSADDVPYLERLFKFQQAQGLDVQWLGGKELTALEPALSPNLAAGIFSAGDVQVDNRALVQALAEHCRAKGATLHEHETFVKYEHAGDALVAHTSVANYTTDIILFTTGVTPLPNVTAPQKIIPVKGQMLSVEPPAGGLLQRTVRIRTRAWGNAYIVPKADRIILGSTAEEMGTDARLTAGGMLDILRKCYLAVPALYDLPVLETWTGLRPATQNRLPFIAKEADAPVYHLNGLYRHGILLAPLMGSAAAQFIVAGTLPPGVAALQA
jgi:glycine oxidase